MTGALSAAKLVAAHCKRDAAVNDADDNVGDHFVAVALNSISASNRVTRLHLQHSIHSNCAL